GSGKHNNWSIATDKENLLDPGKTPASNLRFLVFLAAVIQGVDDYQDVLRIAVASAGNDHRLGANEAPPAVISIFLGDELGREVDAIIAGKEDDGAEAVYMDLGVEVLPSFERDNTDRNRTSPFAFTGNKFELRMVGSQQNISDPNMVLNTAVAEQFDRFATDLEGVAPERFKSKAMAWVRETFKAHQRILFEGNGYAGEWEQEAERRGLPNLKTTPEALPAIIDPANIAFFEKYGVMGASELHARYIAKCEQYAKLLNIEANTMSYMVRHLYLPALIDYSGNVATSVATKAEIGIEASAEREIVNTLTAGIDTIYAAVSDLEAENAEAKRQVTPQAKCDYYLNTVIPAMEHMRRTVDAMERLCGNDYWPVPSYNEMLFYV
ncbi:MAG: glutamine synthetase type III, partial [Coriobacteriaceae bacterium]|nr:glutamine synthetase type III [Coriobacteriaceae bacterium]